MLCEKSIVDMAHFTFVEKAMWLLRSNWYVYRDEHVLIHTY